MLLQDIQREKSDAKEFGIKQKLLQSVSSFVRGPAQAYLQNTLGIVGGALSAFGFIAVSAVANHIGFSIQRRKLLNDYRDELAILKGKDRNLIDETDLEQYLLHAGASQSPIAIDAAIINRNERATQSKSLLKNIAISLSVLTFAALAPQSLVVSMMGYVIIGAMTTGIDIVAEHMLEKWQGAQRPTGSAFIRYIANEMAKEPMTPAKLFEHVVYARPEVGKAVRQKLGEEYAGLSYEKKRAIIEQLGFAAPLQHLAEDLNHGKIRPSELPFLLAGMDSPSTALVGYMPSSSAVSVTTGYEKSAIISHAPNNQVHEAASRGAILRQPALAPTL